MGLEWWDGWVGLGRVGVVAARGERKRKRKRKRRRWYVDRMSILDLW